MKTLIVLLAMVWAVPATAEVRLMMVESDSCPWCEQWHEELGDIYPKTDEAKIAPIFFQDIYSDMPDGITLASDPQYTPTFILLVDGTEVNRIEGYPGDEIFWILLDNMLSALPAQTTDGS